MILVRSLHSHLVVTILRRRICETHKVGSPLSTRFFYIRISQKLNFDRIFKEFKYVITHLHYV
jgi:hypothetical protein